MQRERAMEGKVLHIICFCMMLSLTLRAQTTTNSAGSGTFTNSGTWTNPQNLTGTATIMDGHTVTIPNNINQVYSTKINFSGTGKLVLAGSSSKWVPASSINLSPTIESFNLATNWSASSVYINDAYGVNHNTPWIDSGQGWSAGTANSGTDFLQYDLKSPRWVQGIISQGRANAAQWVTTAKVDVSLDNVNWVPVSSSTGSLTFTMNSDQTTKIYNNFSNVMFARYVRVTPLSSYVYSTMRLGIILRDNIFKSCNDIKTNFPNATSGVYVIDPDGSAGTTPSTNCYCDMETDGGGWTLVLNYLHLGNTNPALVVKTNSLPLQGSTTLGTDESASTTTWGNVSNAYLSIFPFSELRFFAKTTAHSRVIHFKTSHNNTINYFKTGSGSMEGIASSNSHLTGHTANLPNSTQNYFTNQGNASMTEFPFWLYATYHWGIRGSANRWEVDDFVNTSAYSTLHQIWIR